MCTRTLTLKQHDEIQAKHAAGQSYRSLSREYGVSQHMIYKINKIVDNKGTSLWLRGYLRDQQRQREREKQAAVKQDLQRKRECSVCGRVGPVPCVRCGAERWRATHGLASVLEPEDIILELPPDAEARRGQIRSQ